MPSSSKLEVIVEVVVVVSGAHYLSGGVGGWLWRNGNGDYAQPNLAVSISVCM